MKRYLLAFALAFSLSACDLAAVESAVDDFNIILGIESPSTVVGGVVVDAATGNLVEGVVSITFTPSVAGAVVDGFGDPVEGADIEGGAFTFAISDASMPRQTAPVHVAVSVEADGYLPQRRVIALADSGSYGMTIALLSPSRPPSGSGSGSASGTSDGNAGTTAPITATATLDDGSSTTARIAQGTVFTDASGRPLRGDLEVAVTTISPGTPAFASIPVLENGDAAIAAFYVTAAAGSRSATSADTDVDISVTIPDNVLDPSTGLPLQPGDRVEAIAFDVSAGEWVPAGSGVVTAAGAGGRRSGTTIVGATSIVGSPMAYSRSNITLRDVTVRIERNGNEGSVAARAVTASNTIEGVISAGQDSVVLEVPAGAERLETGVTLNGAFYAASPADCVDCVVSLRAPSRPVVVTVSPTCANPERRVYANAMPAYSISAREAGGASWFSVSGSEVVTRGSDGSLESVSLETTALRPGASYDIRVTVLGETEESGVDVPPSGEIEISVEAPSALCQ
ncbi:hypothetical protein [Rubrivirga sp.]|uniref:hypothetical protein n=1 Tax=Rubrivirga sp. TaxID=1885344 RepID=UPI003C75710D